MKKIGHGSREKLSGWMDGSLRKSRASRRRIARRNPVRRGPTSICPRGRASVRIFFISKGALSSPRVKYIPRGAYESGTKARRRRSRRESSETVSRVSISRLPPRMLFPLVSLPVFIGASRVFGPVDGVLRSGRKRTGSVDNRGKCPKCRKNSPTRVFRSRSLRPSRLTRNRDEKDENSLICCNANSRLCKTAAICFFSCFTKPT